MFASTNVIFTNKDSVIFDAVNSGGTSGIVNNSISATWSHTASGAGRMVIVVISVLQNDANYQNHIRDVTYGGSTMLSLGGMHTANTDARPWMEFFYLHNPPTGSQTVSVTVTNTGFNYSRLSGTSISYMNCKGITDVDISHGTETGTALSQTISAKEQSRVIQGFLCYSAFMSGSITGYSETTRYSLAAAGGNADEAMIVGDAAGTTPSVTFTATRPVGGIGYAEIGARLSPDFIAFTEQNINLSNKPVPEGVTGCYVTMIGGGGGGGTGFGAGFTASGGGGGGGGGAVVQRSFISVSDLGSTYSLAVGSGGGSATDGGSTTFTSGSVSITAGGGSKGANGISGNGNRAAGGAAGTASVSGVTGITTVNGTAGGQGGDPGGTASPGTRDGDAAVNNSSGGAPGGGGGGARTSGGVAADGGAGGNSLNATGGAKQSTSDANGNNGGNAGSGQPGGGGGGGAGGNSGSAGVGGSGGTYGAGGGGGGSGNAVAAGGIGAGGYALIEWV